jgi:BirA family transcriptional regulator, biotin operon repressor / biotin---[acetyl-CoA-carboxylase] ligase
MFSIVQQTQFIGKNLIELPFCDSTNDEAQKYLQTQAIIDGTVIITTEQRAGKGQRGNHWLSAPHKNLTFSLLLSPKFLQATEQFKLNVAVSVGIAEALSAYVHTEIKWANDMYVGGKKTGGILIENILQHNYLKYSIIGIGINVNQADFGSIASQPIKTKTPTSLLTETQQTHDLQEVLEKVLLSIEQHYLQLRAGQYENLKLVYLQKMFWFQELHRFEAAGNTFWGMITGIDHLGRLAVAVGNEMKYFDVKEIVFVE